MRRLEGVVAAAALAEMLAFHSTSAGDDLLLGRSRKGEPLAHLKVHLRGLQAMEELLGGRPLFWVPLEAVINDVRHGLRRNASALRTIPWAAQQGLTTA